MKLNIEPQIKSVFTDNSAPFQIKKSPETATETSPSISARQELQFNSSNLKYRLEKKLDSSFPKDITDIKPKTPGASNLTEAELEQQQADNTNAQAELKIKKSVNNQIIHGKGSFIEKAKAIFENLKIDNELKGLETDRKIIDEHLAAIERGDRQAIAFFEAMDQTNASGDPWDMNPGDAFRNSLSPESQKVYDEMLAKLRNDPRIEFQFLDGARDTLAFREIALRGLVAATFGRPQDLEQRIAAGAAASENGHYNITYVPDSYDDPNRPADQEGWGALGGQGGITAKQGFTIQQIANENDNLFIHEFSHTLQADSNGSIQNLPPDFGFFNSIRFRNAFNDPKFQAYIGQTKIDAETFPGIQNRFRQNPQELKDASPEMYQLMVDYSGFDPLTGELV